MPLVTLDRRRRAADRRPPSTSHVLRVALNGESEMDQATYDRWWQLHLRVANGEGLDSTERATYEAGLAVLDAEERAQFDDASLTVLRNLKAEVEVLACS